MRIGMSAVGLPTLATATDEVLAQLKEHRVVAVEGPPASGKSTVLRGVAKRISEDHQSSVFLSVRRIFGSFAGRGSQQLLADDAASVLLASAGAQLDHDGRLMGLVRNPARSWRDKLDAVRQQASRSRAVFVIDEVPSFDHRERSMGSLFEQRTFELLESIRSTDHTKLVFSSSSPVFLAARVQIPASSPVEAILSRDRWNGLGDSAQRLLSFHQGAPEAPGLGTFSPLQLRLAVALVHLGESVEDLVLAPSSIHALIERLFARLEKKAVPIRKLLGRLSLVRVPFRSELIDVLGGGQPLAPNERRLLEACLLYGSPDQLHLHELLRAAATRYGWAGLRSPETHRRLGEYHRRQFKVAQDAADLVTATVHELELVHHLTEAGDGAALDDAHVYFADQYDALGKALSLRKRYAPAVQAYERALAHAPDDWYAHHYRAFNWDVQGLEAAKVAEGYERAVALEPAHLWNHSRVICFYLTQARSEMARRCWNRFRKLPSLEVIADDARLYESVHKHVARLLLDRGYLEFAREVLADIPTRLQRELPWVRALRYLHDRLAEAEANNVVFPTSIDPAERWTRPHTVGRNLLGKVDRWQPGRIASVSEDSVHIRVARRAEGPVEYGWADLDLATFQQTWGLSTAHLGAGSFVELIWFTEGQTLMGTHAPKDDPIPDLPSLWPAPDRYIGRAALARP